MHITESQKKESGANPTRESVDEISVGAMEIILLSLSLCSALEGYTHEAGGRECESESGCGLLHGNALVCAEAQSASLGDYVVIEGA